MSYSWEAYTYYLLYLNDYTAYFDYNTIDRLKCDHQWAFTTYKSAIRRAMMNETVNRSYEW